MVDLLRTLMYMTKRVFYIIPTLLFISILVFAMIRVIPGDPADIVLGERASEESKEAWREKMGLNESVVEQYFIYVKQLLQGDLGHSMKYNRNVSDLMATRLIVTLSLLLTSSIFIIGISIPLGYLAAKHQNGIFDFIITSFSIFSVSAPQFWIGSILLLIFALQFKIFPVGNWGNTFFDHVRALILPGFTIALGSIGLLIKNLRSNIIDIINSDFVDFARSKGIPEGHIMNRHILRNVMISAITLFSLRMAAMFGSTLIVERVFSLPGIGLLLIESIFSRDYATVQSAVLVISLVVLLINLITDTIYSLLDPRVVLK